MNNKLNTLVGDALGGITAMLVALPSASAFGLIIYAPLGEAFSGSAAIGGIMGAIALGLLAPLTGGTKKLITAPCAPAAAVLSAFVTEALNKGSVPPDIIPVYITLVTLFAGAVQLIIGNIGGGKIIKYIPYPVVAGYLSGVGVLIFTGQLHNLAGIPKGTGFWEGLFSPALWKWESGVVGIVTIIMMYAAPKIIKSVPAAILALVSGAATYFALSLINPSLLNLPGNHLVIGPISASFSDLYHTISGRWSMSMALDLANLKMIIAPVLTLAVLLCIDTLKTCVILDALTNSRHNSNRELIGQGCGNMASALLGGIPGAGTMGATLVNLNSGGKTQYSGFFTGLSALLVLLLLGQMVAWIPKAALAGILIVVAIRMVDRNSFSLLSHKSTVFDFVVIIAVVLSAVIFSLITAAGVGIALAILLFLREQMRTDVTRRIAFGNKTFSKKHRPIRERKILEEKGSQTIIIELQGQLFFGTTDRLLTEIRPYLPTNRFAIFDMRRVQSVDYTAVHMFKQVLREVKDHKGYLIFSSVPRNLPTGQHVKKYFEQLGLSEATHLKFFTDTFSALEWVEDEILSEMKIKDDDTVLELRDIELFSGVSESELSTLNAAISDKSFRSGETIFKTGNHGDEIFFIRKGSVKISLPLTGGVSHHIATFTKGAFFGDMSFLDNRVRSADAIADGETVISTLPRKTFNEITKRHPEVAGMFFEKLAHVMANRLRQSNAEMKALEEN
ncbi:MAG: SLC26A/SulP transporter family protein [Bacteroidetes bacterium]|nr:SLC26A/SulP transporter family protein [Bacteroidota bacterium]